MNLTLRIALILVAVQLLLGFIPGYLSLPLYPGTWAVVVVVIGAVWLTEHL